ncbi:MAG: hypothetical protein IKP78_01595 [Ruminococcus sp.]|nr:hypothetical protein [Ruminococcus sp.]
MGKNRTIPFGYMMQNGKWGIIIQDTNDLLRYCQLSNVVITDIQSKKCEETINDLKRIMMA